MRIGITFKATESAFDSGHAQAVLALAERLTEQGYDITLVNCGTVEWWSDISVLKNNYTCVKVDDGLKFDVFIDIEGTCKNRSGTKNILLIKTNPTFEALERVPYISQNAGHSLKDIHEIWVWDIIVKEDSIPFLRTLFQNKPVVRVPYVWTSAILEAYTKGVTVTSPFINKTNSVFAVYCAEKNNTNTSSCLVPFLGAAKSERVSCINLYNATNLQDDEYFQQNIAKGVRKTVAYKGREIYADWLDREDFLVITHGRHIPLRPGLLDLLWLGIPFLHNSTLLRDAGFSAGYYPESEVAEITQLLNVASLQLLVPETEKRRNWLKATFSTGDFKQFLGQTKQQIRIGFSDMWEGFDSYDNFFLDILRSVESPYEILGSDKVEGVDLIICGPFGPKWMNADRKIPKVYFSGERIVPGEINDERISLFLTHALDEDSRHIRLPLWPLFLDWLGNGTKLNRNPNCLPVRLSLEPPPFADRKSFCAFVVSNPTNVERNLAFESLHRWRPVHSAGAYKNNIGGPIPCSYGGGGGGDKAKVAYLQDHEYCLCYENSVAPGYVTEKLLHAKLAGCIPLYRGPPEAVQDFVPEGFVHIQDGEDIVEVVKALETDPDRKRRIAETPALDSKRLRATEEVLAKVASHLFQMALTYQKSKEGNIVIQPPIKMACASTLSSPVFVSFATRAFLPSLSICIQSVAALRAKEAAIRFRAYLGQDVSEDDIMPLKVAHSWVEFCWIPKESPVEGFPDFLEPSMYGWKLWILKTVCEDVELEGELVVYTDAGATWIHMPTDMLQVVGENNVCLIRDRNQINRFWCSDEMCSEMAVTENEKETNQIQAACIGFKAGSEKATAFFEEAYRWGSKKSCLFGDKWLPQHAKTSQNVYVVGTGEYNGHRHDQSIMSILAIRYQIPLLEGLRFSTGVSLRKAYQRAVPMYHHRGRPITHQEVLPKVDDIWTISLDRRADRWAKLLQAHPDLGPLMNRLPGIDGKTLTLTENLGLLFARNDFKWKKSVVGCALSHIMLWAQLVCEHPSVNSYLILEDDVRFVEGYREIWAKAAAVAPADAELLLLGGVLPGNMPIYEKNIIPVNDVWATIQPNGCFTGGRIIPFFHFCAYSYVLTRAGAKKLIDALQMKGVDTSIDNYLTHPVQGLKKYVMRNLIGNCFQASDPVYQKAQFDEFLRIDEYDSDIWNNKECFEPVPPGPILSLWNCLLDVLRTQPHSIQTINTLNEKYLISNNNTVYYYNYRGEGGKNGKNGKGDGLMEESWLKNLMPGITYAPFVSAKDLPLNAWLLVARPNIEFWNRVGTELEELGRQFRVLHLSDEDCRDNLDLYKNRMCIKVIRNYVRAGLNSKVSVIPLGYATGKSEERKTFSERTLEWSFHGSKGNTRELMLTPLKAFEPYDCRFIPQFMDKSATPFYEYQRMIANSKIIPVPGGMNPETFRLYEALEHGAIPLYVRSEGDTLFWNWLQTHLQIMEVKTWAQGAKVLELFRRNPEKAEHYRTGIQEQWLKWKQDSEKLFL